MDGLIMGEEVTKGLLANILTGSPLASIGITPKMIDKDLVIELTTAQLRDLLLSNADAKAKQSVTVELHEGVLKLIVRLW